MEIKKVSEWGSNGESVMIKGRDSTSGVQLQGYSAELQRTRFIQTVEGSVTIDIISQHRMTQGCQMSPDLMSPSGYQMHIQAGNGPTLKRLILRDNFPAARNRMICDTNPGFLSVLYKKGFAYGFGWLHDPADQADVMLFQSAIPKYCSQYFQCTGVFRKETKAAGFHIQPVTGGR